MAAIWAHARLLVDIWSIKLFVWMLGRNGELLDSHLFFFHRYSDLADYHQSKGRLAKAERLFAIAEAHYQAAPHDDDPPKTAVTAMPVPLPPVNTNAVSTMRMTKPQRRSTWSGLEPVVRVVLLDEAQRRFEADEYGVRAHAVHRARATAAGGPGR